MRLPISSSPACSDILLCWVVKLYYFLNFQSCKAVYTQLTGVWGERKVKASKKAYSV